MLLTRPLPKPAPALAAAYSVDGVRGSTNRGVTGQTPHAKSPSRAVVVAAGEPENRGAIQGGGRGWVHRQVPGASAQQTTGRIERSGYLFERVNTICAADHCLQVVEEHIARIRWVKHDTSDESLRTDRRPRGAAVLAAKDRDRKSVV